MMIVKLTNINTNIRSYWLIGRKKRTFVTRWAAPTCHCKFKANLFLNFPSKLSNIYLFGQEEVYNIHFFQKYYIYSQQDKCSVHRDL